MNSNCSGKAIIENHRASVDDMYTGRNVQVRSGLILNFGADAPNNVLNTEIHAADINAAMAKAPSKIGTPTKGRRDPTKAKDEV